MSAVSVWATRLPARCGPAAAEGRRALSGGDSGEKTTKELLDEAARYSQKFDPATPETFGTGWEGRYKAMQHINAPFQELIWSRVQLQCVRWFVDEDFSIKDTFPYLHQSYRIIRHVSANAKTEKDLDLIKPLISEDYLRNLKENLADSSASERNLGVAVHSAFGTVAKAVIEFDSEDFAETNWRLGTSTNRTDRVEFMKTCSKFLLRTEWLTLKIRFVAIEEDFVFDPSGEKQPGVIENRVSTWTFKGKVWNLKREDDDPNSPPLITEDLPEGVRKRNPVLTWVLTKIEA
mmetsp:Transcript_30580/g.72665  ORF Transcript_30580/g.72665 Transcript_30580/m.72665 type:complete len:291 (+) Transcript_30580:2-874(+)